MSFKFGSGGSAAAGGPGRGGLYAGISLDGQQSEDPPTDPSPPQEAAAPTLAPPPAETSKVVEAKDKTPGTWSASLRFAPVIRKPANKTAPAGFRPAGFSSPAASSGSGAVVTNPLLAMGADDEDDAPAPPPSKGMHIPGKAKAALTATPTGPAVDKSAQYSVFARQGGFLAAHAPERHPAHAAALAAATAAAATPSASDATTENAKPDSVDEGIPGFQHTRSALLASTSTLGALANTSAPRVLRRKLDQLPPLTLPEEETRSRAVVASKGDDVNGFAQTEEGKKLAQKSARSNKKKKGKNKQPQELDLNRYFAEDYDPARPNDYHEWIGFLKDRRLERREAARRRRMEDEARKREEEYESGSYSSDSRDSDNDGDRPAPRGKSADESDLSRFFAPPADYDAPPRPAQEEDDEPYRPPPLPAAPPPRAETGDDAYQRRLAMSQGRAAPASSGPMIGPTRDEPQTGDEASLRRMAMSGPQPAPVLPPSSRMSGRPVATDLMDDGPPLDDVDGVPYLQVEADTRVVEPAKPAAPTDHSAMIAEAQARAKAIAERFAKAAPTVEPPSTAPPPPPAEEAPTLAPAGPSQAILEAQARARAIAARLGELGAADAAQAAAEQASKAPGQAGFARRFMDRHGWKEGHGLGASESGRTSILTVETQTAQKRKKADVAADPDEPPRKQNIIGLGAGSVGKGMGMVVDAERAAREKTEREKYGEPTRIVMLTNMVGPEEVDDELGDEISEEARKHGIVERCFVRVLQRPCEPHEAVRVFVKFSGLAGAWKTVKAFDGRYFGGRDVRARFFPEQLFEAGHFDA